MRELRSFYEWRAASLSFSSWPLSEVAAVT